MHHSTIYFHLRFLSSSLFFFSIFSHVTGTVNTAFCSHGSCTLPNAIPTGCLPAPTAPPVRRRELHLRRAAPSIDYNEPSFVEIERKQEDVPTMQQDIKVILGRGNPICYYPSTVLGTWLKDGFTTETFVLPVGRYAVKWIERYANPEAAAATIYFKLYRKGGRSLGANMLITHIATYGSTFISDGVSAMFLILKHLNERPSAAKQEVEVWIQEIVH